MAMVECSECKGRVSEKAWACPRCGKPQLAFPAWQWKMAVIGALVSLPLSWCMSMYRDRVEVSICVAAWIALWCAAGMSAVLDRWNSRV